MNKVIKDIKYMYLSLGLKPIPKVKNRDYCVGLQNQLQRQYHQESWTLQRELKYCAQIMLAP